MPSMPDNNDNGMVDGKIRCLSMSRNGRYSGFVNRAIQHNSFDTRWYSNFYISSDYGASYSKLADPGNRGYNLDTNNNTNNENTGQNMLISNDGNTIIVARFGWGYLHIKTSDNQYWTYLIMHNNNISIQCNIYGW